MANTIYRGGPVEKPTKYLSSSSPLVMASSLATVNFSTECIFGLVLYGHYRQSLRTVSSQSLSANHFDVLLLLLLLLLLLPRFKLIF